jgi:putative ABC transport system permease protein
LGGILLSWPALTALLVILPKELTWGKPVRLSVPVFLFTLGVSLATGVFFGVVAMLNVNRMQVSSVLKDVGAGTTAGRSKLQMQSALVVMQFALSLVLLSGAGLMIRSFLALRKTDPGFSAHGVLINSQLVLPRDKYSTNEQRVLFFRQLIDRIQGFPDAEFVGGITSLPLTGTSLFKGYQILGRPEASTAGERAAVWNVVTEDYFKTMRIRLIQGRELSVKDNESAPRVALINEALARAQFPDDSPIGQRILLNDRGSVPCEIVGVVASSRQFALARDPAPEIFTPYRQSRVPYMYVVVKSRRDPMALVGPIRGAVKEIDPDQPVGQRQCHCGSPAECASLEHIRCVGGAACGDRDLWGCFVSGGQAHPRNRNTNGAGREPRKCFAKRPRPRTSAGWIGSGDWTHSIHDGRTIISEISLSSRRK